MASKALLQAVGRHPVRTLLIVLVLIFAVFTLLAVFAGETHHSSYAH
jgi:hypothetical protein